MGLARGAAGASGEEDRPRRGAGEGVGSGRGARVRRGLADGRMGAQPRRRRDRASEPEPAGELRARVARLHAGRRCRLAVLRSRLHRCEGPRRVQGPRLGPRGAREAWPAADPRLRAEPRRARPRVDIGAPGVLRRRERGGRRARPGLVREGRRPGAGERPRPVLPRVARRGAAQRVLVGPARRRDRHARPGRRAVRRHPLRHGDADDERHLRAHLGRARRRAACGRLLADGDRRA